MQEIIISICEKNNIKYELLSKNWIIKLEKNNKIRFITGYKFGINDHAFGLILDDKYALYELLKSLDIPVASHNILYSENNQNAYAHGANSYKLVEDYYDLHKDIVLKTNNGTCGHNVFHITEKRQIKSILNKLFIDNESISYCPFYDIKNEYRVVVLNGEIKLIFKKKKPIVYGDGKSSIKDLLIKFNSKYFSNISLDDSYNKILAKDESFEYSWKFNLAQGANASLEMDPNLKKKIISIANRIISKLPKGFYSIDIIDTKNELLVLEVNSGVMMERIQNLIPNGKTIVYHIYEEAINSMFNETK